MIKERQKKYLPTFERSHKGTQLVFELFLLSQKTKCVFKILYTV